ncbi:YolD-like family protein [Virgibacillus dokdonensis]|uniref:YolD-like family protein n=1 Tax=Virgibacillus dokdonensis TaxID=302167 RepID=A0A2K9IZQ1_9BACI|nr:YolD-like family protein [Virgibacillus dokdonensis]AUJ23231.1 YolD-like protein [Virgibacillus dokdonensis]
MRIYDRGAIKWTSMMLPEHVDLLQDMWEKLERKEMPILDEQKLEELDVQLQAAVRQGIVIEIKYFNGRDFLTSKGKLKQITNEYLYLQSGKAIKRGQVLDIWT